VNLQGRVLPDEGARSAGVVQVDVAEQEVPDVGQREPAGREPPFEGSDVGRRAAVEQREAVVRLEQVATDDPLGAEVVEID
jgi:hypothetical protein